MKLEDDVVVTDYDQLEIKESKRSREDNFKPVHRSSVQLHRSIENTPSVSTVALSQIIIREDRLKQQVAAYGRRGSVDNPLLHVYKRRIALQSPNAKENETQSKISLEKIEKQRLKLLELEEQKMNTRVKHLKQEEEKILRSITDTKTRAEKIFEAKKRNEEKLIERMRIRNEQEQLVLMSQAMNREMKEESLLRKQNLQKQIEELRKEQAKSISLSKQHHKQSKLELIQQQQEAASENFYLKKSKYQLKELRTKIEANQQEKNSNQQRILEIKSQVDGKLLTIQKLEKQEQDLMQRIQQTQKVQLEVSAILKKVVNHQ